MEILQRFQHHLLPFATDALRAGIWLLLIMFVFVPLERLFAVHPQKVFHKSFPTDLGYYFLNSLLPNMFLVTLTAFIAAGLHYLIPPGLHAWVADMPLWTRMAALIVGEIGFIGGIAGRTRFPCCGAFMRYTIARRRSTGWSIHAHPFDIIFVRICGFIPMYALGLAQPAMGSKLDVAPLLILFVGTLWGFFIHANLRWRFGWLGLVVSTPAFHHWHHTNDEHINKNYASMLPFMDKLFDAWYMPKKQWPPKYGIDAAMPPGLTAQLLHLLMPMDDNRSTQVGSGEVGSGGVGSAQVDG